MQALFLSVYTIATPYIKIKNQGIYEYSHILWEFYNNKFNYKEKETYKYIKHSDSNTNKEKSFIKRLLDKLFEVDFIVTFNSKFVKEIIEYESNRVWIDYDISSLRFVDLMKPTAEIVNWEDWNWPKFGDLYKELFNYNYVNIDSSHDVDIVLQCFLELKEKTYLYDFKNLYSRNWNKPFKTKKQFDLKYLPSIFTHDILNLSKPWNETLSIKEDNIIKWLHKVKMETQENKFWVMKYGEKFFNEELSKEKFLQEVSKLDIHEINFLYWITILSDKYEHRCYGFSEFDCYVSHIDYYYDLYCPNEELTDKECEFLSKCECRSLILPFCNKISDRWMEYISQFKWKWLWLPSLDRITVNQAKVLAKFKWNIWEKRDCIHSHSDKCDYIYRNSWLHLNWLVRLTDKECEELSKCSCTIYLDWISYLTDQWMKFLSTSNNIWWEYDDETICLDWLKSLNDKQTKYITQSKKIYFSWENLGSISDKQAKYLSKDLHGFKNFKILTEKQRVILKLDWKKLTWWSKIKYNILSFLYKLF